ncbi:hypothetical protein QC763_608823 [Podospora pseudopauciseta]|uniref:Ecp2 effector protein domain-containing protein n=1 Tax=Podospora pseudopauciseta TaxID=2093780 RepID=A0ABR0H6G9_9PEZI|nr:hypothetical protein QC763_608823 [Podospora pseudopauciseta]
MCSSYPLLTLNPLAGYSLLAALYPSAITNPHGFRLPFNPHRQESSRRQFCCVALCYSLSAANYTIVDVQWDLTIQPGNASSDTISVNGAIENAIDEMGYLHLGQNQTFQNYLRALAQANTARDTEDPTGWGCDIEGVVCQAWAPEKGITYLRGVEGTPKNGPGPNECGRVSCGYGAAIHWCNENGFEKEVTRDGIADGAEDLKGLCGTHRRWSTVKVRVDFKDNWNMVVVENDC